MNWYPSSNVFKISHRKDDFQENLFCAVLNGQQPSERKPEKTETLKIDNLSQFFRLPYCVALLSVALCALLLFYHSTPSLWDTLIWNTWNSPQKSLWSFRFPAYPRLTIVNFHWQLSFLNLSIFTYCCISQLTFSGSDKHFAHQSIFFTPTSIHFTIPVFLILTQNKFFRRETFDAWLCETLLQTGKISPSKGFFFSRYEILLVCLFCSRFHRLRVQQQLTAGLYYARFSFFNVQTSGIRLNFQSLTGGRVNFRVPAMRENSLKHKQTGFKIFWIMNFRDSLHLLVLENFGSFVTFPNNGRSKHIIVFEP